MQDLMIEWKDDKSHLYEQIYSYIKEEIRKGKLLYREKLPSTRSLAQYLQVSRSTVEVAYEQLLSEGYIEAVPYKGYFVAKVEELYRLREVMADKTDREKTDGQAGGAAGCMAEENDGWVDFSPNAIEMRSFPFGTWRRINKNVLNQDNRELFLPGDPKGDFGLRETIARYLHASRGVNCNAAQIIVGAGNDYLLLLLRYVLGEDCRAAFENPTYPRARQIFGLFSKEVTSAAADENGIIVDELEKSGANVVYVMPSHQYPTGRVMPIGRRAELLNWAAADDQRYVIEDDYDSEFRYRGKPIPSLQASDTAEKVIYIGTFSKSIAPAIRVSFLVLPKGLMERYEERCSCFSSTVSRIDQAVLEEFLKSGAFERHLNRMRKEYSKKHEILLEGLKPFLKNFRVSGENAGLHVLLTSCRGRSEEWMKERARQNGVKVYGLSEAMTGTDGQKRDQVVRAGLFSEADAGRYGSLRTMGGTVLLGFGGLTEEAIEDGLERLKKAWL